ncbi:universal stress protein [Pseudonocardia sp. GCM10023141]|uniref:universal stress protein n=1 Tax=Pseudonocardia sp. GCM10023141 TaxID=3252653 RepID=UPI003614A112
MVVGVDGSPGSLDAVRWATAEAARRGAPLRLVTAFDQADDRLVGLPGVGSRYRDILLEQAEEALSAAATFAAELEPDVEVETALVVGFPIGTLAAESRHARLLVVGDRGLSRIVAAMTGSVAVGLATHAKCPVVVVRDVTPATAARAPVVVGVDGSPVSEAAIAFAFEAASARHAPLVAVHTWGDPPADARTAVYWDVVAADAKELLAERLAGWNEKYPDVHVERVVTHSRPARKLLALSESAQLVVVGSRGHGDLTGLLLGSVANVLVHRAGCPVAVVRSDRSG